MARGRGLAETGEKGAQGQENPLGWAHWATDPTVQQLVQQQLALRPPPDPAHLALDLRRQHPQLSPEQAAAVATQLALAERAAQKLPSWVAAGAAWHRETLEQATGARAAELSWGSQAFGRVIDLTAGLGVDTWALAQRAETVVAIEADADRAQLLRYNLPRVLSATGASRVTVVHAEAEAWLRSYAGPTFDLAYADPARRSARMAKAVALADLLPDPRRLEQALMGKARRLRLKLSPLFDPAEALRVWPQANVQVVSVGGEVKAVLVDVFLENTAVGDLSGAPARNTLSALGDGFELICPIANWPPPPPSVVALGAYVWLPDAALIKARLDAAWAAAHLSGAGALAPGGFWTAAEPPPGTPPAGRWLQVVDAWPYKPDVLKRQFAAQGLRQAHVLARGVEEASARVAQRLGLSEGGEAYLLVGLQANGQSRSARVCVHCRRVHRPAG